MERAEAAEGTSTTFSISLRLFLLLILEVFTFSILSGTTTENTEVFGDQVADHCSASVSFRVQAQTSVLILWL